MRVSSRRLTTAAAPESAAPATVPAPRRLATTTTHLQPFSDEITVDISDISPRRRRHRSAARRAAHGSTGTGIYGTAGPAIAPSSGRARRRQREDAGIPARHAGVAEGTAIAQQPVHAREIVVRHRHQQVMLEVVVH